MKYQYTGLTKHKEKVRGVVDAADEIEARMRLRSMQIRPLELKRGGGGGLSFSLGSLSEVKLDEISIGNPVSIKKMMVFTRQFSSLIDSGVPVVQCLDILWQQEKKGPLKNVLVKLKTDIESGSSLAAALSKHPRIFSEFFVRIVEAGELSGTLDKALKRVGAQLEKLSRLRSKVIGALIYPVITLIIAVGVLGFLLVKVVPEITKLYAQGKAKLPELTEFVLELSKWAQLHYMTVLLSVIGFVVSIFVLYRVPVIKSFLDRLVLKLPLFGPLVQKSAVARLSRTLSTLISSGVPLIQAFEICVKLMANTAIKEAVQRASAFVTEGKTIAAGLASGGVFPPMFIHMVDIGEVTGKLDELLGKVADIYDEEVDDSVSNITGLLQPGMIVIVGFMIAFLLMAMYLPIFQMADKIVGG